MSASALLSHQLGTDSTTVKVVKYSLSLKSSTAFHFSAMLGGLFREYHSSPTALGRPHPGVTKEHSHFCDWSGNIQTCPVILSEITDDRGIVRCEGVITLTPMIDKFHVITQSKIH